jgi:hypothetical protein
MASMWKRGTRRQHPGIAIAAVRLSCDESFASVWAAYEQMSSTGSPP